MLSCAVQILPWRNALCVSLYRASTPLPLTRVLVATLHTNAARPSGQSLTSLRAWAVALVSGAATLAAARYVQAPDAKCLQPASLAALNASSLPKDLPEYSNEEVAAHNSTSTGIWVTYRSGVYDITELVDVHPGGKSKIMLAAGGAIDPYWVEYKQHDKPEVRQMLEDYKIGTVKGWTEQQATSMKMKKPQPPSVDGATFTLEVQMAGQHNSRWSLQQLHSSFPKHTMEASTRCKGPKVPEVWGGVLLTDLIERALQDAGDAAVKHQMAVEFQGLDGQKYTSSGDHKGLLVAYEVNGTPLSPEKGFPLRVVCVDGGGARSVKWLSRVTIVAK